MQVSINANFKEFLKAIEKLPNKIVIPATVQSLNRAARDGKSAAIRALVSVTGIKRKAVKNRVTGGTKGARATRKRLNARIFIRTDKPVKYSHAFSGRQMKRISSLDRSSFFATLESGKFSKFRRTGGPKKIPIRGAYKGRLIKRGARKGKPILREPIEELAIPLHPHGTNAAAAAFRKRAKQVLIRELSRNIERRLTKAKKR